MFFRFYEQVAVVYEQLRVKYEQLRTGYERLYIIYEQLAQLPSGYTQLTQTKSLPDPPGRLSSFKTVETGCGANSQKCRRVQAVPRSRLVRQCRLRSPQ